MPELTIDQLQSLRQDGFSDDEIALRISEGRDDIKNAMEDGFALDEIVTFFSSHQAPKQEEKQEKK